MANKQQLTIAQLATAFGVSSVSIYLWRQGTPTKTALEAPHTPANLRRWAKKNGVEFAKDPERVLGKSQDKPVAKPKAKPVLKRSASGKLSGVKSMTNRQAAASGKLKVKPVAVFGGVTKSAKPGREARVGA
jgi:hypothetical protein